MLAVVFPFRRAQWRAHEKARKRAWKASAAGAAAAARGTRVAYTTNTKLQELFSFCDFYVACLKFHLQDKGENRTRMNKK